eukprot:6306913-Prymnesium_polylepis.1
MRPGGMGKGRAAWCVARRVEAGGRGYWLLAIELTNHMVIGNGIALTSIHFHAKTSWSSDKCSSIGELAGG